MKSQPFKYIHQFILQGIQGHEIELGKGKPHEVSYIKVCTLFAELSYVSFGEEEEKEKELINRMMQNVLFLFFNIRIHSGKCDTTSYYNLNNFLSGMQSFNTTLKERQAYRNHYNISLQLCSTTHTLKEKEAINLVSEFFGK